MIKMVGDCKEEIDIVHHSLSPWANDTVLAPLPCIPGENIIPYRLDIQFFPLYT